MYGGVTGRTKGSAVFIVDCCVQASGLCCLGRLVFEGFVKLDGNGGVCMYVLVRGEELASALAFVCLVVTRV